MAIISITDPVVGEATKLQKFLDALANQRTLDSSADVASRGNLVVNGSFEKTSSGTPIGWTFTDYTGGSHSLDATNNAHGAQGIKFTSTSTANGGGYCESTDFLEIAGSEVYYWFAFRMASVANVSAQITARWYDASQTFISSSTLFQDTSAPTSMTSTEGAVAAPSTARYVKLRVEGGVPGVGTATGSITFDDIRLRLTEVQSSIGARAVGQGELKNATTNGSQAISASSNGSYTLTGGSWSWWTASATDPFGSAGEILFGAGNTAAGVIGLYNRALSLGTFYVDENYIQASRPYNTGDGDYGLVVYVLLDKNGGIHGTRVGPDPMWAYNGPTNIASKGGFRMEKRCIVEDYQGKINIVQALRDPAKRQTMMEYMSGKGCEMIPLEITHEIKNRDMNLYPHPFMGQDLTDKTVVMLDPVSDFAHQLLEVHEQGEISIRDEFLLAGQFNISNTALKRSGPPGVMCVKFRWK